MKLARQKCFDYPLTSAEIGRQLGMTRANVEMATYQALKKLRDMRPETLARFRQAVHEKRRAIDARTPNRPWTDIDAEGEVISDEW